VSTSTIATATWHAPSMSSEDYYDAVCSVIRCDAHPLFSELASLADDIYRLDNSSSSTISPLQTTTDHSSNNVFSLCPKRLSRLICTMKVFSTAIIAALAAGNTLAQSQEYGAGLLEALQSAGLTSLASAAQNASALVSIANVAPHTVEHSILTLLPHI